MAANPIVPFDLETIQILSTKCCPRCILRLAHVNSNVYEKSESEISTLLGLEDNIIADGLCSTCFGILSDRSFNQDESNSLLNQLINLLRITDYSFDQFSFSFTFPHVILLRQFLVIYNIYKLNKIKVDPKKWKIIELKEALRFSILPKLLSIFPRYEFVSRSNLEIQVTYTHEETNGDIAILNNNNKNNNEDTQKRHNKKCRTIEDSTRNILNYINQFVLNDPPTNWHELCGLVRTEPLFTTNVYRQSIYVIGNYLKYDRYLSQTPWIIDGSKKIENSLEDFIKPYVQSKHQADSSIFHAAGREDIDVRMLGNGRPFIIELVNSKRDKLTSDEYLELAQEINTHCEIEVRGIRYCSKESFNMIQIGAEEKKKKYICIVQTNQKISDELLKNRIDLLEDLEVTQKTPLRVLHRRTLMDRKKIIFNLRTELINDYFFVLYITTSAGTYVKEFVHGDLGRTQPNIGTLLGMDTDIIQLDVEELLEIPLPQ